MNNTKAFIAGLSLLVVANIVCLFMQQGTMDKYDERVLKLQELSVDLTTAK